MKVVNTRVRQARRQAEISQQTLAERVGVHRSAVAQWERAGGSHPTVENAARIAMTTGVNFEWLMTGRGRMIFASNIIPGDETPAVLLEYSAQTETEVRALAAMRRLDFNSQQVIVEMLEGLSRPKTVKPLKLGRATPYSR